MSNKQRVCLHNPPGENESVLKRTANGGRGGIIYAPDNRILGLYDQWGRPYRVFIDANGNGRLDNLPFPDAESSPVNRPVGVWSIGKDGKTGGFLNDDVKSW